VEVAEHYRGQREELSALALSLTEEQLGTVVPGCPAWQVREVLSHLVGLTADLCTGSMEGAGTPAWAQVQVDARRDHTVEQVIEEWTKRSEGFEVALPQLGFLGWVFTYDVTMHGDDIREALGLPLGSSETHAVVLDGIIERARGRAEGLGTLTITSGGGEWVLGGGLPHATLRVDDPGELARVIGGRRDDQLVRALAWEGDPGPWLPVLPLFREGR
jgi:uncharacterized protein (TIGR03083 family)